MRSLRLVFADGEAADRAAAPNGDICSEWERNDIETTASAAIALIGGLFTLKAYSRQTAVSVGRIAERFDVPAWKLLAVAGLLKCGAFAVLRDDENGQSRLWLADRSAVEKHAERLRDEAREHERAAKDLERFAAGMRC